LGEARILAEETARTMREPLFMHDPRLPATAHGFYQSEFAGRRVVGHDGGMPAFVSRLLLILELELVGLFVSYNAPGGGLPAE